MQRTKTYFLLLVFLFLLVLSASSTLAEEKTIRILHFNDFHGFAEPYKPYGSDKELGGISFLATKIHRLRSHKDVPTLLLAGGDMIQGHNWANFSQGKSVIEIMNLLKLDAMVIGNHELDFGQEVLKKRISEAKFPFLAANVTGMEALKPYLILNVGSMRIGILGVVTEDTPIASNPANMTGLKFVAPKDAVEKYLPYLKNSADIIMILSHIGHQNDKRLAEEVKGINAIIGGHSHTRVTSPPIIGNTIILQGWEHGKALGVVDITIDHGKIVKTKAYLEEIDPTMEKPDQEVATVVRNYITMVDKVLDEEIGKALCDLDGVNIRKKETNLGNLVADIIRETAHADAALINGGSIRTSIMKGTIRIKDIYSVLPFNNYITAIRLKGIQVRQVLEHAISGNAGENSGAFPQVSNMEFSYDSSLPAGKRIKEILIAGNRIEMEKEYIVATNDFIVAGGDGFKAFGDAIRSSNDFAVVGGALKGDKLVYNDSGRWIRDVVVAYIKSHNVIAPREEHRINRIDYP